MTQQTLVTIPYSAPSGAVIAFKAARLETGAHVFPFTEIAQALEYETAKWVKPRCDPAHVVSVKFENTPRARKCVTVEGLFTATPRSRTDTPDKPLPGPATHFHGWLRAVILPMLASTAWPVSALRQAELRRDWKKAHRDRLTEEIQRLDDWIAKECAAPTQPPTLPVPRSAYAPPTQKFETAAFDVEPDF
jgi:hypothetical protein